MSAFNPYKEPFDRRIAGWSGRLVLRARYPEMVVVGAMNALVCATINLSYELAKVFPEITFWMTPIESEVHDAINVRWTDGPTADQVESVVAKYRTGRAVFDGSDFEPIDTIWTDTFGGAMYVSLNREYSPHLAAADDRENRSCSETQMTFNADTNVTIVEESDTRH